MVESALRSALSRVPGVDKALPFLDMDGPVNVVRLAWDRLRGGVSVDQVKNATEGRLVVEGEIPEMQI